MFRLTLVLLVDMYIYKKPEETTKMKITTVCLKQKLSKVMQKNANNGPKYVITGHLT